MFSQRSFRPIEELPPPHSAVQDLTSPFEGEDEFDQLDPRFTPHSRSRASSTADEQVPARVEFNKVRSPTKGAEESVEELDEVSLSSGTTFALST